MDPSKGSQAERQRIVGKHLERFQHAISEVYEEMLAERDRTYSEERSNHLQEINALRIQLARTEELEAENKKLSVELVEARQQHQRLSRLDARRNNSKVETKTENQTVDIEEYNRVKEDLGNLGGDYGKLAWARDHLETKIRQQKDSLREWKQYYNNWILNHPNKRLSHLKPSSARASPLANEEISSSAPAPPALPGCLTPSLNPLSTTPSPGRKTPADAEDRKFRNDQRSECCGKGRGPVLEETNVSQVGHNIAHASDSGDVTEATPDSEGRAEPIKIEPATGGSSPIVLFERPLKRRHSARGSAQKNHVHEDERRHPEAARGTRHAKYEHLSSPTLGPPLLHSNEPPDSLDLDDVGGHLDTPRKRQRMAQEQLRYSMVVPPLVSAQDEDTMPNSMTAAEQPRDFSDDKPEIEGERGEQASFFAETSGTLAKKRPEEEKKARKDERLARQHAHNDRVHQRLKPADRSNPTSDLPRSSSPTSGPSAQRPLTSKDAGQIGKPKPQLASAVTLQPRDVNGSVLPRTSDPSSNRKRPCPPSRRDRGAAYVPALAEDGEGLSSNGEASKARKKPKVDQTDSHGVADQIFKQPTTHHRLGALLTKKSPEKSLLQFEEPVDDGFPCRIESKTPIPRSVVDNNSRSPVTPRSVSAKRSEPDQSQSGCADFEPVAVTIYRNSKSAQAVSKKTRNAQALRKPPVDCSEIRPEHEPMRARPVHRLGLQDFRLNPAHGEYAYHESVRKHDEKKYISGCTDRRCTRCKGLREFVINSGYKTAQKPGENEADADWRLMREFLGDSRRQLRGMSTKEKSELLTEAKVKEFANRYGCHRQAFSRAREAPGMWEVDFPTTQEDERDRAAADVMEREKVQERYWEAMRPNGKWVFADE